MKIGDRVYIIGYINEIRKDVVIIRNDSGYFGTEKHNVFVAESVKKREAKGKWIPCSERLPEENGRYLVTFQERTTDICWFQNKHFRIFGEIKDKFVSAWMPLPEPYCSMGENYGFPSKEEADEWMDGSPAGKEEI